jgi:hypothetical protein
MSNEPIVKSSKRRILLGFVAFIGLWILLAGLIFYPSITFNLVLPVLMLCLALANFYQGIQVIEKQKINEKAEKWYKQYNIVFAIAWILGFAMYPIIYFIPGQKFVLMKAIVVGIFCIGMLIFLVYAILLFYRQKSNLPK